MAKTANYQTVYTQMRLAHSSEFEEFEKLHARYIQDPKTWQGEFNVKGSAILDIIRHYERVLCGKVSSGVYSKYAKNLSEKFLNQVRKDFPLIDSIGIE